MGPAATATYKGNPSERYSSRHNTSFQLSDKKCYRIVLLTINKTWGPCQVHVLLIIDIQK